MSEPIEAAPAANLSAEDAALIGQGAALDGAALPPPVDAAGNAVAPVDYGSEASMLLKALVGIAAPFYPSVPRIWTPDKQSAVAAAAAPVMEKYGFTLGDFMGQWGEELTLLIVAGPVVLETVDGIKADRAERKAAAGRAPAANDAAGWSAAGASAEPQA